MSPTALLK